MAHENALDEDRNLRFLFEDVPEERDEVDSVSKQVINFESGSAYLPKYFIDSENHAVRKETRKLRMVSEKLLKKFGHNFSHRHDGVAVLLAFKDDIEDEQAKKLPSLLSDICNGLVVLYSSSNFAIVHMEARSYTVLGDKIFQGNGYKVQNFIITHLEALSLDPLPSCFLELQTPKSNGEMIQKEFSNMLVTFCGSFKYLRLGEGGELDLEAHNAPACPTPSVNLTLLFSKRAQRNAEKFNAMLSDKDSPWIRYEAPDVVRVPFEQLFVLKNCPALPLGFISASDIPGVRISVMFSTKKDEMVEFYRVVTGTTPYCRSDKNGTSYIIYSVATHLELQLIYNFTIRADTSNDVVICVRITDHEKISTALHQSLTSIDAGHWEAFDPVGNRIRLFTPFEGKIQ